MIRTLSLIGLILTFSCDTSIVKVPPPQDVKWDQIVMATSGCVLTASAAEAMKTDQKIQDWWRACN